MTSIWWWIINVNFKKRPLFWRMLSITPCWSQDGWQNICQNCSRLTFTSNQHQLAFEVYFWDTSWETQGKLQLVQPDTWQTSEKEHGVSTEWFILKLPIVSVQQSLKTQGVWSGPLSHDWDWKRKMLSLSRDAIKRGKYKSFGTIMQQCCD